jgi:hypothetical protein
VKIYLDVCAIQRPLDSPGQVRVILEAEAVLGILALCDAGRLELVSSDALIYETEQNPLPVRQEHARAILSKAIGIMRLSDEVKSRSSQFVESGLRPLDALHLALAEAGKVDYFCTCDDSLLGTARRVTGLQVRTISPIDLVQEIEK